MFHVAKLRIKFEGNLSFGEGNLSFGKVKVKSD